MDDLVKHSLCVTENTARVPSRKPKESKKHHSKDEKPLKGIFSILACGVRT
jgi:hypothetical protein